MTVFVTPTGPYWIYFGGNVASRGVPSEVQIAFRVRFGLGIAFNAAFHSKTSPILEPKFVQNRAGSNQKSKKKSFIELDVIF